MRNEVKTEQQYWTDKIRKWQVESCEHCGAYGGIAQTLEWDNVETITVECRCPNCHRVKGAGAWQQPQQN